MRTPHWTGTEKRATLGGISRLPRGLASVCRPTTDALYPATLVACREGTTVGNSLSQAMGFAGGRTASYAPRAWPP